MAQGRRAAVVALILVACMLAGCVGVAWRSPGKRERFLSAQSTVSSQAASHEATLTDSAGRTPDKVVSLLLGAINRRDYATAYSLYATPTIPLATYRRTMAQAAERYSSVRVGDTRRVDPNTAEVNVTYTARTTPPGGEPYSVVVSGQGEWWPLSLVGGEWRVHWMPRQ